MYRLLRVEEWTDPEVASSYCPDCSHCCCLQVLSPPLLPSLSPLVACASPLLPLSLTTSLKHCRWLLFVSASYRPPPPPPLITSIGSSFLPFIAPHSMFTPSSTASFTLMSISRGEKSERVAAGTEPFTQTHHSFLVNAGLNQRGEGGGWWGCGFSHGASNRELPLQRAASVASVASPHWDGAVSMAAQGLSGCISKHVHSRQMPPVEGGSPRCCCSGLSFPKVYKAEWAHPPDIQYVVVNI